MSVKAQIDHRPDFITEKESRMPDPSPATSASATRRVVVLSRDLFFGMRIRNALKQMGFATVLTKTEAEFEAAITSEPSLPVLALIDFNHAVHWRAIATMVEAYADLPVLAFGAHTDTASFKAAREAGVTRVISNGAFSQQLPELVEKYARKA